MVIWSYDHTYESDLESLERLAWRRISRKRSLDVYPFSLQYFLYWISKRSSLEYVDSMIWSRCGSLSNEIAFDMISSAVAFLPNCFLFTLFSMDLIERDVDRRTLTGTVELDDVAACFLFCDVWVDSVMVFCFPVRFIVYGNWFWAVSCVAGALGDSKE